MPRSCHQLSTRLGVVALLIAALALTACDDDSLVSPDTDDDLFDRYVSLGNSITAGFQSNGINEETQRDAYPVLLAEQMGTEFNIPRLNPPGCPAPLVNAIPQEREGEAEPEECALRETPSPRVLNNVAVPGAGTIDVLDNRDEASNPSPLTTFILGGRTQIEAAEAVNPTFASVWIGNNDVLGAAIQGVASPEAVTAPADFQNRLTDTLDDLEAAGAEGGLLIGVADVTLIPHLSAGAAYFDQEEAINQAGEELSPVWGSFTVDDSCAPDADGLDTLVPFQYGFGELVSEAALNNDVTLNCAADERVLSEDEVELLATTVADYNEFLQSEADARGWAYVDPNPTFAELAGEGLIPPFPNIADPADPFGPIFSLDGVHPSSATHQLVTNEAIEAINDTYGTSLAPVDAPDFSE